MNTSEKLQKVAALNLQIEELEGNYAKVEERYDKTCETLRVADTNLHATKHTIARVRKLIKLPEAVLTKLDNKKTAAKERLTKARKKENTAYKKIGVLYRELNTLREKRKALSETGAFCPHCGKEGMEVEY